MVAFLVDTNVLVYAHDLTQPAKTGRARACIQRLGEARNAAITAQILGEFFVIATRRLHPPVHAAEAEAFVVNLSRSWPVYDVTGIAVIDAIRAVRQHQLQYWDALIWASARLNGVPNVLTEDVPSGDLIEGVRFVNPFQPTFDLDRLG